MRMCVALSCVAWRGVHVYRVVHSMSACLCACAPVGGLARASPPIIGAPDDQHPVPIGAPWIMSA